MRQISFQKQVKVDHKITSDIKHCENLTLNMDLQLHEKNDEGQKAKDQNRSYLKAIAAV